MKVPEHEGMGAVRFSLGRDTTRLDIDEALQLINAALR
jgi:cysteine sulfinate desulfinase/cysteine desulfurase-like protein